MAFSSKQSSILLIITVLFSFHSACSDNGAGNSQRDGGAGTDMDDHSDENSDEDTDGDLDEDAHSDKDSYEDSDANAHSDSDTDIDSEADTIPDDESDTDAELDSDTADDSESDTDGNSDADSNTDTDSEVQDDLDPDSESATDAESESGTGVEAETETEEVNSDSELETNDDSDTDSVDESGSDTSVNTNVDPNGPIDPWVMRDLLGRGLNIKAFLLNGAPGWGATYNSSYADVIQNAGFDSVRIWAFVQSESGDHLNYANDADNTLDPNFFTELDERVFDFLDKDMAVILNFFEAGGFETGTNQWKSVFVNLWTQIAEHYQDAPYRLIFQPINESHDDLDTVLSDWYAAVTDAIRATNPDRIIVYSPPFWGKGDLADLTIPASAGQYYMGGVHPYEPFCYTHQGWSGCDTGIHWSDTPTNTDPITDLLDTSLAWSQAHDKPVVADEWGTAQTPDAGEQIAWAEYVRDACFSRGMAITYFDFVDAHDWGIYNLSGNRWRNDALIDVLTGGTAPWDF